MEVLFHLLGIVYYTVALIHLVAERNAKRRERQGEQDH